jgi:hypothetical protein
MRSDRNGMPSSPYMHAPTCVAPKQAVSIQVERLPTHVCPLPHPSQNNKRIKHTRYPLFACRSKRKCKRVEKRKDLNAVVMKYECPINPPNPLTNARLRVLVR